MAADDEQRIGQLTPFARALAVIDELSPPVGPREIDTVDAAGRVLAADVIAGKLPPRAVALQDGWAVKADDLADAGSYAPVQFARAPQRVETGDEMPPGTDAVAPLDAVGMRGDGAEAVAPVTAGEGVAAAGSEADRSTPLGRTGKCVRNAQLAAFAAAGIARLTVRTPRLLIIAAREDLRLLPAMQMVLRDCAARGGVALSRNRIALADALRDDDCDAIVVIGGSGAGARDRSVRTLAAAGTVAVHGVGLTPGETAAIGHAGARPVLILPGRLDGALAAWLTLGRRMLARLAGQDEQEPAAALTLSRKVTSTIGLAEVVPVRRGGASAEPLAGRTLPLWALAQANGWLLVPPESEGFPAGAEVAIYDWP
jgi:molybdopterin biosynthesis enzyme